jgi:HEAT repeat protein
MTWGAGNTTQSPAYDCAARPDPSNCFFRFDAVVFGSAIMRGVAAGLVFFAGAAVACAAYFVGREMRVDAGSTSVDAASHDRKLDDVAARLSDLEARVDALARTSGAVAVRSDAPASSGVSAPNSTAKANDPNAGAGAPGAGGDANGANRFAGFDDLRKLRDETDDKARLALAKKMLTDPNQFTSLSALRVVADLDPKEALATVSKWVDQSAKGDVPTWQVDRALATLVDSKGAATIAADLDTKLHDWFQTGSDDLKHSSARSLETRGDAGPMSQLVASYQADTSNADPGKRTRAIDSLGRTQSRQAVPVLVPLLADTNEEVRLGTLDALRRTGDESVIDKVKPLLDDPVAAVRDRATRTMESLRRGDRNNWGNWGQGGFGGFGGGGGFGGQPGDTSGRRGGRRGGNGG